MKVIFAKHVGFCTGVRRALEIARVSLLEDKKPVQFLGEIIHNERATKNIMEKGGKLISTLNEVRPGTLVVRAHGAPPLPKLKGVKISDATCPLVTRAQAAAKNLFDEKYKVIIIGEKKHPEIKGINGHIGNRAVIIENKSDAKKLKKIEKIGVIAQTTQNLDGVNEIIKILESKTKNLKWINTLCPQVTFRQKELAEIIKKADAVMVIGSKTSANTSRLAEIAQNKGKKVLRINSAAELDKNAFKGISILGVVSGTSAPDWDVSEIKNWLTKNLKT